MNTSERRIAKQCITDLLAAGFVISVYDGEETTLRRSDNLTAIINAMGTTDEDHLFAYLPDVKGPKGRVFFVYGNEPGVVIADYTTNLEECLTKTNQLSQRIADQA